MTAANPSERRLSRSAAFAARLKTSIGLPLVLLAALLVVVAVFRSPILFDDRTWYDENAVLLQGHAIYPVEWPPVFRQQDIYSDPSLGDVLIRVKSGAYPPAMPTLIFFLSKTTNPVRTLRRLLFALGLLLLVITYSTARVAGDRWFALLATAYVASSTLLTHSSQQIKWISIAPMISLFAASLVLHSSSESGKRVRPAYILAITLLLHVHYFCLWVIPGHLLYALVFDRQQLISRIKELSIALAAATPWYVCALPTQLDFVRRHFDNVAQLEVTAWNIPMSLVAALRRLGYDFATAAGVLPLPLKGRYLVPILLIIVWCLAKAVTSPMQGRRKLSFLAVACAGSAAAAQTLYALKEGNVVPLQPIYLSPWFPLLMIAILAGAAEIGSRSLRMIVVGTIMGG